jgi:hypothetical protein
VKVIATPSSVSATDAVVPGTSIGHIPPALPGAPCACASLIAGGGVAGVLFELPQASMSADIAIAVSSFSLLIRSLLSQLVE